MSAVRQLARRPPPWARRKTPASGATRARRRIRYVALIIAGFLLGSQGVAFAYFSLSGSGTHGLAAGGHLNPATNFATSNLTTSTLTLTWTAPTEPTGVTLTSHVITPTAGSPQSEGTCSKPTPTSPCTVTGLRPGAHYAFTLTYKDHTWSATTSVSVTTSASITASPATAGLPLFTSAPSAAFAQGKAGNFTVTTAGAPASQVTNASWTGTTQSPACATSSYPSGLAFSPQSNGTSSIAATATVPTGIYTFCLEATNTYGSAYQTFTLRVAPSGALTFLGIGSPTTWTGAPHAAKPVPFPTGTSPNDLLLLVVVGNDQSGPWTAPAGWSGGDLGANPTKGAFPHAMVFWRVHTTSTTSVWVIPSTTGQSATAWVVAYDSNGLTPSAASAAMCGPGQVPGACGYAGATATLTPPVKVTANHKAATEIAIGMVTGTNSLSLAPASKGFTFQGTSTAPGSGDAIGIADESVAISGTAPTEPIWRQSGTAAPWAWATLAFDPPTTPASSPLAPTVTSVSLSTSPQAGGTSVAGQPLLITAQVNGGPSGMMPGGTVTFTVTGHNGAAVACSEGTTQTVSPSWIATCALPPGLLQAVDSPYTATAQYSGSSTLAPSTAPLTPVQVVNPDPTTTRLTVTQGSHLDPTRSNPSTPGGQTSFTATVSANAPGSGTPQGAVTFAATSKDHTGQPTTLCGSVPLANDTAMCTSGTTLSTGGPYLVTATYTPTPANYGPSSAAWTQPGQRAPVASAP